MVERWSATENCDSRSTSSPQRSMRTGWSAVDGIDVDDRAAHRELAARFDLVLAPVAHRDELLDELVAVDAARPAGRRSVRRLRRAGRAAARARGPARRRPRAGWSPSGAQPPHDAEAPAHRLGRGRHPLERQRLPRREQLHRVGTEVLRAGRRRCARPRRRSGPRAGRAGARSRTRASRRRARAPVRAPRPVCPARRSRRRSIGSSASSVVSPARGAVSVMPFVPHSTRVPRDVPGMRAAPRRGCRTCRCRRSAYALQRRGRRGRPLYLVMAASTPSARIISTASAASSTVTSISVAVALAEPVEHVVGAVLLGRRACRHRCARAGTRRSCRCCMIERSPLWPARPPPTFTCSTAGGRSSSSCTITSWSRSRRRSAARAARRPGPSRSCT